MSGRGRVCRIFEWNCGPSISLETLLWAAGGRGARPLAVQAGRRAGETYSLPGVGSVQLSSSKQLRVATKHEQAGVSGRWQQILLPTPGLWASA